MKTADQVKEFMQNFTEEDLKNFNRDMEVIKQLRLLYPCPVEFMRFLLVALTGTVRSNNLDHKACVANLQAGFDVIQEIQKNPIEKH